MLDVDHAMPVDEVDVILAYASVFEPMDHEQSVRLCTYSAYKYRRYIYKYSTNKSQHST